METLDTPQIQNQPSFQESISMGFYLLERYDENSTTDFRGITADMVYEIYISSNWEISESGHPPKALDPNDVQWSIKAQQERLAGASMLANQFYFQPIPPEHIQKVSVESLPTEITRLTELQKTQSYKDRVDQILNEE